MRNPHERALALECLRLAQAHAVTTIERPEEIAARFYAFVTGIDADDAKARLAVVREAVR